MHKTILRIVTALALGPACAGLAISQTIDFDGFPSSNAGLSAGLLGVEDGFNITYTPGSGGFAIINAPALCGPACASNGTNALYSFNTGSITLNRVDGASFSLLSLDLAQTFTTSNRPLDVKVTGLLSAGGAVSFEIHSPMSMADVFQSFFAPTSFSGLTALTLSGMFNYPSTEFAVDNIAFAAPVPEPETYAMLLAGLGLLGFAARRRAKRTPLA